MTPLSTARGAGAAFLAFAALASCTGDEPAFVGGEAPASDAAAAADTSTSGEEDATSGPGDGGKDAAPPEPPRVIAAKQPAPYALAVTDQSLVYLTATEVRRCPLDSCPMPFVVAEDVVQPSALPRPYSIDADATEVHWFSQRLGSSGAFYFRCPLTECFGKTPAPRYPGDGPLENPSQLSLGADGVARIAEKFTVRECGATTCTAIPGVSGDSLRSFAYVPATRTVFWAHTTDPGGLYRSVDGDAGMQLHGKPGPVTAVHGGKVYVLSTIANAITTCAETGCGGEPLVFVENEPGVTSMAVGPTGVYWTGGSADAADGYVKTCALSGCEGTKRIIAQNLARPTSVRLRGAHVYWVTQGLGADDGTVMRAGL